MTTLGDSYTTVCAKGKNNFHEEICLALKTCYHDIQQGWCNTNVGQKRGIAGRPKRSLFFRN